MFLGLKPPYDSAGPLGAFLSEDVTFLDSLILCLATTSMIMLSLASNVSMGGTLMLGLTVRDKYRQLKNKDLSYDHILPCSNGIKLCNWRRQQLISNKREVFLGLNCNTKARFWWTSTVMYSHMRHTLCAPIIIKIVINAAFLDVLIYNACYIHQWWIKWLDWLN